jgi:glycerate 2-kinase
LQEELTMIADPVQVKNRAELVSHGNIAGRNIVLDILEAGLKGPDPYPNVKKIVRLEGNKLIIYGPEFNYDPKAKPLEFNLKDIKHIYVAGGGKAAQREAQALEDILGDLITEGQVNTKRGDDLLCKRIHVTFAGHPIPDEDSVAGAEKILEIYQKAREGDIVFFVTSGGGTALKALPAPGISLHDLQEIYRILYFQCGSSMPEANAVRNIMTIVRGKAAKWVKGATLIELQTPENQPVAGAAVYKAPNYTNAYEKAIEVLNYYNIWDEVPEAVRVYLLKKNPAYLPPTPEEIKQRPYQRFRVVGPEYMFDAAEKKAREMGINVTMLCSSLNDIEAKPVGEVLGSIAEEEQITGRPTPPPCVLLTGGETPVAIGNETGIGGRNQELLLSASPRIAGCKDVVMASVDSDGTDGPGKYAGGIVDGFTFDRVKAAGFDLTTELRHHNSTPVLEALGDAIYTGNTGTNVRDLRIIYVGGVNK